MLAIPFLWFSAGWMLFRCCCCCCSTSVSVFFNNEGNYCDAYDCTVSGYVNDYVEGQDSLSLCQVQADGEVVYNNEKFDSPISLTFDLPEVSRSEKSVLHETHT